MRRDGHSFGEEVWKLAGGRPKENAWRSPEQVPAETADSLGMSRELRRRGFRFVGPTICYAFMQAVGMVNDHLVGCFRHRQVRR
jgi:DNA-3-methyladenine glycosylase I